MREASVIAAAVTAAAAVYFTLSVPVEGETARRLAAPGICLLLIAAEELAERKLCRLPDRLGAAVRLLTIACIVGGRSFGLYSLQGYDKILHTASGAIAAAVGAYVCRERTGAGALAAAAVGLLTALSVEYIWELLEYFGDVLLGMDNQRWSTGLIGRAEYPGAWLVTDPHGSAIADTMEDMLVCLLGAVAAFAAIIAQADYKLRGLFKLRGV